MKEQQPIITAFSEMAPRYESLMNNELNRFWGLGYEEFIETLLHDFTAEPNHRILDIATGTGFIPSYIFKRQNEFAGITGLDLTFSMLKFAQKNLVDGSQKKPVNLVCASAHNMPFKTKSYDHVICCLATHHMDVPVLINNIERVLKCSGKAYIADAGGSSKWKNYFIKTIIKAGAFFYFLITENYARAIAESASIVNIHTQDEWRKMLSAYDFSDVHIQLIKSKKFWAPDPILIKVTK